MKKLFLPLLCAALPFALGVSPARADSFSSFEDIDSLLEDNTLTETANRYNALILSYQPERATRLGYTSANDALTQRTPVANSSLLAALNAVQESLQEVDSKKLSPSKKADYEILKANLETDIHAAQTKQPLQNPLYYAQAFDAVYDLILKQLSATASQNNALLARMRALAGTSDQAQRNLTEPAGMNAQLAMEKAYYAYLAFDEITDRLQKNVQDDITRAQMTAETNAAKKNIKAMFDLFKQLAKDNEGKDFRLGKDEYALVLENTYFIPSKKLAKTLQTNYDDALANLRLALEPFMTYADGEEIFVDEETPAQPKKKMTKKERKSFLAALSPRDFYAVVKQLPAQTPEEKTLLEEFANETARLAQFFAQDGSLPQIKTRVTVREMPAYVAYQRPYLFVAPFGMQNEPSYDFFLRLPTGNSLNKKAMLEKDFNLPTRKLTLTGELIPGRYFQAAFGGVSFTPRGMHPVPTLQNGWSVYAQHLAAERGYIVTDEERLYLAWADFTRAAAALADYNLHNKQMTYSQALAFLTQQSGLEQEDAEKVLKDSAAAPGEAVSYVIGFQAIEQTRQKYQKKLGKKFSLADFHAKLLGLGAIPPSRLNEEIKNAYDADKKRDKNTAAESLYQM